MTPLKTSLRKNIVLSLCVAFLVALSYSFSLFSATEARIEDNFFDKKTVKSDTIIIAIDDDSLSALGQWPWGRSLYADLITTLKSAPPKVLGIDILLSEKSARGERDDLLLQKALLDVNFPIVFASQALNLTLSKTEVIAESLIKPLPLFLTSSSTSFGIINVIDDTDAVVRHFPYRTTLSTSTYSHFALQILKKAQVTLVKNTPYSPLERIVYSTTKNSFTTVSFKDALAHPELYNFKDKIILLGATASSLRDNQKTPLSKGAETPGVIIHASILEMLREGKKLAPVSPFVEVLLILALAVLTCLLLQFVRRLEVAIFCIILLTIFTTLGTILFFERGYTLSLVHLLLSLILTASLLLLRRFRESEKIRESIQKTFSKYVSPTVLELILKNQETITLGGEEREITVLFSDIRGFTSISEDMSPTELVTLLNRYFGAVTKEIIEHDGVLDKYIGDAIMAFWGAPLTDEMQADKAIRTAQGMLRRLEELNKELVAEGKREIHIGVGIYTGKAVVGNVGSDLRFDYTAIGDTVNAASRIEGLTKDYSQKIIIGESTKMHIKNKEEFVLTNLGAQEVKGKAESITIYGIE